jgi:hypothetical protein
MKLAGVAFPCLLLLASGCGGAPVENLVARAQFDLSCPEQEIRVTKIDDRTRGITGCGRRATYIEVCDMTGWGPMNCRWVANSPDVTGTPAATGNVMPPPAPPPVVPAPVPR